MNADEMLLRIGAKGNDGKAKPLRINDDGSLYVSSSTQNMSGTRTNKASLIDALDYTTEIIETPYRVRDVDKNGRIYVAHSHYIRYSDDDGETWSSHITDETTPTIRRLIALDNGDLLQVGVRGEIWKTDSSLNNWRMVLEDVGGTTLDEASLFHYNNIVLASNYGSNLDFLQVWISTDYGDTWKNIMRENPPVAWNHMHCVAYDPYENLIWAANGDDYADYDGTISRIWYTADFGEHWEYFTGARVTAIVPLPDRVLFLSDVAGRMSVFSHERPKRGTNTIRDNRPASYINKWGFIDTKDWRAPNGLKESYFFQVLEDEALAQASQWASTPYIKFGKNFKSIFGFRTTTSTPAKPVILWGTTTGEDFIPIWTTYRNVLGGYGVGGVYGTEDKIVAAVNLEDENGTLKDYALILRPNT